MTEISFYHLATLPLEKALPKLMEKVYSTGIRAIIRTESPEKVEKINDLLWSYSSRTFLPHGSQKNGNLDQQPIYITHANDNPNSAKILVLTDGLEANDVDDFERCLDVFDGSNETELLNARKRWGNYKKSGHQLTYWKQGENGAWEKGG